MAKKIISKVVVDKKPIMPNRAAADNKPIMPEGGKPTKGRAHAHYPGLVHFYHGKKK